MFACVCLTMLLYHIFKAGYDMTVKNAFKSFKYVFIFFSVCGKWKKYMCHCVYMEVRRKFVGVGHFLPPCGFQEWNSSHLVWQQVLQPAQSWHQSRHLIFISTTKIIQKISHLSLNHYLQISKIQLRHLPNAN